MKIAVEYTQHLNPGQIAVGCSDQPLYAWKKTIQLAYPDEFGTNYFCFMGGLHVEQAALVCIGQLITGSGMEDIDTTASLEIVGLKTAVCDVNNIKKAHYTLQVIAVVLSKKLNDTFNARDADDRDMEDWIATQQNYPMCNYWYNLLKSIKVVLLIVRSFREANIDLLIIGLEQIVPLFFALDLVHNHDLQFHLKVEALVVDLSVVTRAQASFITPGSTFNDLSESIIKNITGTANLHEPNRVNMVIDQYSDMSIKHPTRCD